MKRAAAMLLIGVLILGQPFSAMGVRAQETAEESQIQETANDSPADKTETVYVKTDAEGNVQEISVETVLKNRNNGESLPISEIWRVMKNLPKMGMEPYYGKTMGRTFPIRERAATAFRYP